MIKRIVCIIVIILLPQLVFAGAGKIKGKVVDKASKEPLVGASVVIEGTTEGAVSDVDGKYLILNVSANTYTLKVSYIGYQAITISNIRVYNDLTTEQNFELPAVGVQVPTVEIVAERPLVNKSATNAVRIIDNEFFAKLPSRGIDAAVQLQPGVVQLGNNVYIRGGRLDETGYQLEGMDIGNKLFGGRGVTFAAEAVQQIQVQAGGYSAQFGGANAGIVTSELRTGNADAWRVSLLSETDQMASQGNQTLGTYSYGYSDYTLTLNGPVSGKAVRFFGSVQNTFYRNAEIDPITGTPTPRVWAGLNFTGPNALITSSAPSYLHPKTSAADTLNISYPAGDRLAGSSNQYAYSGTMLFDQYPYQIRLAGSFRSQDAFDPIELTDYLNAARTPEHLFKDGSGNIKGTYTVDPKSYLVVSLNYVYNSNITQDPLLGNAFDLYGDSTANARLGYTFLKQSTPLTAYSVFGGGNIPNGPGVSINQPGTPIAGYDNINQNGIGGRADYTTVLGNHEIKFGGEYMRYTMRRFNAGGTISTGTSATWGRAEIIQNPLYTLAQKTVLLRKLNPGLDNYGYDVFGNQIDNDVILNGNITDFGPRHPINSAAYLEDEIQLSDLVIKAGLRYDHIKSDGYSFVDPTHLTSIDSLGIIATSSLLQTPQTDQISPRLGFSFPVTDRTIFHAQYGKFIQQSRLRDAYLGMGSTYHYIAGGNFVLNPSGFGLRPERTTGYEMGFQQQASDLASFDITAFYKDIADQVQYTQILPGAGANQKSYPAFINGDFSTTEGVEIAFTLRRTHRVQAQVNYTFQNAATTGSNPSSLAGAVVASTGGPFIPHYIFPADFNETHRGNILLDYRFGMGDGGPVFERSGINLLAQFNSGHPFTLLQIIDPGVTDPRGRTPIEEIGASTTPWFFQLDGRIDKTVSFGSVDVNFYIYVQNLLGTDNAVNVYPRTGDPGNDGWLSTPTGIAAVQTNGPQYAAFYNALFNGPNASQGVSNYGIPREIRFGFRLDY
ncbi:MAG: carboxypeptidase-like regulatory domain-containing protein [Bacteroidota bacterium]